MAVHVPAKETAQSDSFIDDLIRFFLDTPWSRAREPHAVPLVIHVTSQPHAGDTEAVKRRDLVYQPKLIAGGGPEEAQIVLGWTLNTRSLLVILLYDKLEAWSSRDLNEIIVERAQRDFQTTRNNSGKTKACGLPHPAVTTFPEPDQTPTPGL